MRPATLLLLTLGSFGIAACTSATPSAPAPHERDGPILSEVPDPALFFPTAVGATWVYEWSQSLREPVTWTTTSVEEKDGAKYVAVAEVEDGGSLRHMMTVRVSPGEVCLVDTSTAERNPPLCELRVPEGKTARWEAEVWVKDKKTELATKEVRRFVAHEPEEVRVPAGRCTAIRVEAWEVWRGGEGRKTTQWYAPGVGLIKEEREGGTVKTGPQKVVFVLKEFTPGKP